MHKKIIPVAYFKSIMYAIKHDGYDPYNSQTHLQRVMWNDNLTWTMGHKLNRVTGRA